MRTKPQVSLRWLLCLVAIVALMAWGATLLRPKEIEPRMSVWHVRGGSRKTTLLIAIVHSDGSRCEIDDNEPYAVADEIVWQAQGKRLHKKGAELLSNREFSAAYKKVFSHANSVARVTSLPVDDWLVKKKTPGSNASVEIPRTLEAELVRSRKKWE